MTKYCECKAEAAPNERGWCDTCGSKIGRPNHRRTARFTPGRVEATLGTMKDSRIALVQATLEELGVEGASIRVRRALEVAAGDGSVREVRLIVDPLEDGVTRKGRVYVGNELSNFGIEIDGDMINDPDNRTFKYLVNHVLGMPNVKVDDKKVSPFSCLLQALKLVMHQGYLVQPSGFLRLTMDSNGILWEPWLNGSLIPVRNAVQPWRVAGRKRE
jgi:hypothetical protein